MEQKIPKILHYCWFGGNPKPQLVLKCIESWKKYCPDYRIIEWNESNFDIHSSAFAEEAYQARKWAFVSDYVRASALLQYGGVYLDTDMELVRSIDPLLEHSFFAGFEVKDTIASAIIGCRKEEDTIRRYFEYYKENHYFIDGGNTATTSPIVLTDILLRKGLILNGKKQNISGCMIYPKSVFCPTGIKWVFGKYGRKTIASHYFMDSWGKNPQSGERSKRSKLRICLLCAARNTLGTSTMYKLGQRLQNKK